MLSNKKRHTIEFWTRKGIRHQILSKTIILLDLLLLLIVHSSPILPLLMLTWQQMIFRLVDEVKILVDIAKLTQQCEHHSHLNFCMAKAWWHGCVVTQLGDTILDLPK